MALTIKKCIKKSLEATQLSQRCCFVQFEEIRGIYELDFPEFPKGTILDINNYGFCVIDAKRGSGVSKEELTQLFLLYNKVKAFLCYKDISTIWLHNRKGCFNVFSLNPYSFFDERFYPKFVQEKYGFTYSDLLKNIVPTTFNIRREEIGMCFSEELKKEEGVGNTYLEYNVLCNRVKEDLEIANHGLLKQELDLSPFLYRKVKDNFLYCDIDKFNSNSPVFRREMYEIEENIYNNVKYLINSSSMFQNIIMVDNPLLSEEQNGAVSDIITSPCNINILSGGPGTGKTTIINEIIRRIKEYDINCYIAIVAPTGRASKRAEETIEYRSDTIQISTIHKFIGYGNTYSEENDVKNMDLIIIDEASMLSPSIFQRLLSSMDKENTKLVLVGDVDQLPSIEPGDVLSDLIHLGVPTNYLTQNYRSLDVIVGNSRLINKGIVELKWTSEFKLVDITKMSAEQINALVIEDFSNKLFNYDDSSQNGIIISPYIVDDIFYSSGNLNRQMHSEYDNRFPNYPKLFQYRYGEPVILTKTNYHACVPYFNGEIGKVVSYHATGMFVEYEVEIGERRVIVPSNDLELAYSITVHKSQGCEYDDVFFVSPQKTDFITRKLLYTAITRAKKSVTLYITMNILKEIINNTSDKKRKTLLKLKTPYKILDKTKGNSQQ